MFLILQLGPFLCIIIPQHQSLIELNTNNNTIACDDVTIGAVEIKTTTTHFCSPLILHDLLHIPPKTIDLSFSPSSSLSYPSPTASPSPLPCMLEAPLATHFSIANFFT